VKKTPYHIIHTTISPCDHERRIFNEVISAEKKDYRVKILALKTPGLPEKDRFRHTEIFRISIKHWAGSPLKFLAFNWRLFLQLRKEKFLILHVHDLWVLPASVIAAIIFQKPVIYDVHEYSRGLEIFRKKKISGLLWKFSEKIFIRFVQIIIVINKYHGKLISNDHFNIPEPVILMNFPSLEENNKNYLNDFSHRDNLAIYQGILKEDRGLKRIIESMLSVKSGCLKIVGYGELENELKELVNNYNLQKKINFGGKISWDRLYLETSRARAGLVLFEPEGLNYTYASPNKFFEYVHAGTPVIASNIPSFDDLVGENKVGILVNHNSITEIAGAIEKLLTNKDIWDDFHRECLKARQEWNWEQQEEKLLRIYQDLILKYQVAGQGLCNFENKV
jgi:glycosyltransferase involved in cell wall biosynthesis